MNITNDQIEFTTDDFAGFSDPVKKALSVYLEDYAAHFANSLNAFVTAAKQHAKNLAAADPAVSAVLESYANADEAKRASVEQSLSDLNDQLKS